MVTPLTKSTNSTCSVSNIYNLESSLGEEYTQLSILRFMHKSILEYINFIKLMTMISTI
jgi:hypothetical protein